jgi:hypothetical protein
MPDAPPLDNLRDELGAVLAEPLVPDDPVARVRRSARATSIVIDAFDRRGLRATLVGGGAIEFHAPAAYATDDVDLVIEQRFVPTFRADLAAVFAALGFTRRGRHWVRDGMFVEVPGVWMGDPVEEYQIGAHRLRVVRPGPEVVLADRIVGFRHWRYTGYAAQAIAMLGAFGDAIDEDWLRDRLRREGAEDAYDALLALQRSGERLHDADFEALLDSLAPNSRPEQDARGGGDAT